MANEVTRLERLERAWARNREQLRYTLASAVEREKARGRDVEAIEQAIARRVDTRGEKFAMTIGAVHYTERTAAAQALIRWAQTAPLGRTAPVGQLGGFQVDGVVKVDYVNGGREAYLALEGVPAEWAHATLKHLGESPLTLLRQLEHRIADLEERRTRTIVSRQQAAQDIARAREGLERPFKYAAELHARRTELATITEQMRAAAQSAPAPADTSPPARAGPGRHVGRRRRRRARRHVAARAARPRDGSRAPGREPARFRARPRPPRRRLQTFTTTAAGSGIEI